MRWWNLIQSEEIWPDYRKVSTPKASPVRFQVFDSKQAIAVKAVVFQSPSFMLTNHIFVSVMCDPFILFCLNHKWSYHRHITSKHSIFSLLKICSFFCFLDTNPYWIKWANRVFDNHYLNILGEHTPVWYFYGNKKQTKIKLLIFEPENPKWFLK